MSYHNLESILGKTWLENHPDHIFNQWITKPDNSNEKLLLSRFDTYVGKVIPFLRAKRKIQDRIRNQLVDTYNELEVGCSLIDKGFNVDFEKILLGKRSKLTPDIFIENDNVIMEVKTLHRSAEAEKGMKSYRVFTFDEAKRIRDDLFEELEKYREQKIEHPLIVVVCPDIIKPPLGSQDDFETVLYFQENRMTVCGAFRSMGIKVKYKGLYFSEYGEQTAILSGVGWWSWKRKGMLFYPNPNVKKTSKIPQDSFLYYLRPRKLLNPCHDMSL